MDDTDLAIVLETFGLNAWQWQYDALGRVVAAQSCNGQYQCEYDALGRRIWQSRTTSGSGGPTTETTFFLYGPGFEIELDEEGGVKAETAFGLLGPVARWAGAGLQGEGNGDWMLVDLGGSVRKAVRPSTGGLSAIGLYNYSAMGETEFEWEAPGYAQPHRWRAGHDARWEPIAGGYIAPQGEVYASQLAVPQKARLIGDHGQDMVDYWHNVFEQEARNALRKVWKEAIQESLDYAGMIPGLIGMGADFVNSLIYFVDGDYCNGAISLSSLAGQDWLKAGRKGLKIADDAPIPGRSPQNRPTTITGYTKHGINSAISHPGGGVSPKAILDAFKNPVKVEYDGARKTFSFIGEHAVLVLNAVGEVVTSYPLTESGRRLK